MNNQNRFRDAVLSERRFVFAYEAMPPVQSSTPEQILEAAEQTCQSLKPIRSLDALLLPQVDINEIGKDGTQRKREPSIPPRTYARALRNYTSADVGLCHRTGDVPLDQPQRWVQESVAMGYVNFLPVGPDSEKAHSPDPLAFARMVGQLEGTFQGGICIPWRGLLPHQQNGRFQVEEWREPRKMRAKEHAGIQYHLTQILYETGHLWQTWQRYRGLCAEHEKTPARILLGLSPIINEKNAAFLEWLGVVLPPGVRRQIDPATSGAADRSCAYLITMVEQFLDRALAEDPTARFGISVECVHPRSQLNRTIAAEFLDAVQNRLAQYETTGQPCAKAL